MKLYKGKINTNFHKNKIPKEGCECICLSAKLVDSVYKRFLFSSVFSRIETCCWRKKDVVETIDNIEISSDVTDKEDSNKEKYNKKIRYKTFLIFGLCKFPPVI